MSGIFSPTFEQKAMITNTDLDSVLEKMSGSSNMHSLKLDQQITVPNINKVNAMRP